MRKHGYQIDKATVRERLPVRAEPYWSSLGRGRALGYRRSEVRKGIWYGRWTEPREPAADSRPKYRTEALGDVLEMDHTQAVEEAQNFFDRCIKDWERAQSGGAEPVKMDTVEEACRAYVANLRIEKSDEPAQFAEGLFKANVYQHEIAKIRLEFLAVTNVEAWRNGLVRKPQLKRRGRSKKGANRIYRQFAAALSYAKKCGAIRSDETWKKVGQFPVKDGRRPAYLTMVQRHALIAACEREKTVEELAADREAGRKELLYCTKDLADLLRGYFYSGARPGELAKARVRDLSVREAKLTLHSAKNKKGETRPRDFYLFEPGALVFFKRMAHGKSPDEYLITMADGSPWVNEKGAPNNVRRSRGMRAAVREANRTLDAENQIPTGTVTYTTRHTVITDLLSEDGLDVPAVEELTGTSPEMIRQNYYKVVRERLKGKLSKRTSL